MEQLAARRAHNPKVGGSSPPPATKADNSTELSVFFVCRNEWSGKRRAICSSRSRYHKISKAMKENKDTACEPCEQNFERNINRLVKEGKAPTPKARQQKEHEVKSAFAETGKERK